MEGFALVSFFLRVCPFWKFKAEGESSDMITKIRKRNGDIVDFNPQKIQDAISKASAAVADEEISPAQLKELTKTVVAALPAGEIPTAG